LSLVGMKRVGIHTFLRFFLFHPNAAEQYIHKMGRHINILVDLNDLIERELFPFWRLTLKRIADTVELSALSEEIKRKISQKFTMAIQLGDEFLTYDSVREALRILSAEVMPTLFFTRFDRLQEKLTKDFFANLEAMREASQGKLSYVFTSFREHELLTSSLFAATHYIEPANYQDADATLLAFAQRQHVVLSKEEIELLLDTAGGHMQLLHNLLLVLAPIQSGLEEMRKSKGKKDAENFPKLAIMDERVSFLLEEIWESFQEGEQKILRQIALGIYEESLSADSYLLKTGMVIKRGNKYRLFVQVLTDYIIQQGHRESVSSSLSEKESLLFNLLKNNKEQVCSRDMIVAAVWPEYEDSGVTDWSIDRLVARLRVKLKDQGGKYEIVTVRTRGYKLVLQSPHG